MGKVGKSKAMLMDWHIANKSEDGVMRSPTNSKTWQIVEDQWPQFKKEPTHLKLGLTKNRSTHTFYNNQHI
jgi:hypothetical protein